MRARVLTGALVLAAPAHAQQPQLIAGIGVGVTTQTELWSVPLQPALVPLGGGALDSVALVSRWAPALQAAMHVTWFRAAHWGWTFEASYYHARTERRCALVGAAFNTADPDQTNAQACSRLKSDRAQTNAMAFFAGPTVRAGSDQGAQVHGRLVGGLMITGGSFVHTGATVTTGGCARCERVFLTTTRRSPIRPAGGLSVGASLRFAAGLRARFEARSLVLAVLDATGPASPLDLTAEAPTATRLHTLLSFTGGLDILLQRRRGRRY